MSETIKFQIQTLDEYTRTPIRNAKLQLQNINIGQEVMSDSKGIASFKIDSKENLNPFRAKLIHKDYQAYPVWDRSIILNAIKRRDGPLELRFRKKLDNFAVQQVTLEPNKYRLTEANNEIITKNFYKAGDTLIFKTSFDESKTKENEIKWAYKMMNLNEIQMLQQQDCKDKNPQSTQIHSFELDEIPNDTLQILQDSKISFSKNPAYTIKNSKANEAEPENIYKGKTLKITLPKGFENKQIAIFAYKNEPNWKVCYIIRLNDYPQITIDCTLAETLRANTNNDEISRLGWGVSYICQRLWHDNPSNARELGELIYIDSKSQDFIDSIPNETMKKIVKDILPRIEIKEFDGKAKRQNSIKGSIKFYIELDWYALYLKFPIIQYLNNKYKIFGKSQDLYTFKYELGSKIITDKLRYEWQSFIRYHKQTIAKYFTENNQKLIFDIDINKENIKKIFGGKKYTFKECVNINPQKTIIDENIQKIDTLAPQILQKLQLQRFDLTDDIFAEFVGIKKIDILVADRKSIENKIKEYRHSSSTIALYAIIGKFNIYYVPSKIYVRKLPFSLKLDYEACLAEMYCYVYDSFDFRDQLEQLVGTWDYSSLKFNVYDSMRQLFKYKKGIDAFIAERRNGELTQDEIDSKMQSNYYFIYNKHYQQVQNFFNLGCDFRLYSSKFLKISFSYDIPVHRTLKYEF